MKQELMRQKTAAEESRESELKKSQQSRQHATAAVPLVSTNILPSNADVPVPSVLPAQLLKVTCKLFRTVQQRASPVLSLSHFFRRFRHCLRIQPRIIMSKFNRKNFVKFSMTPRRQVSHHCLAGQQFLYAMVFNTDCNICYLAINKLSLLQLLWNSLLFHNLIRSLRLELIHVSLPSRVMAQLMTMGWIVFILIVPIFQVN